MGYEPDYDLGCDDIKRMLEKALPMVEVVDVVWPYVLAKCVPKSDPVWDEASGEWVDSEDPKIPLRNASEEFNSFTDHEYVVGIGSGSRKSGPTSDLFSLDGHVCLLLVLHGAARHAGGR